MQAKEFEEQNVVIAKDQPPYNPLPSHAANGFVTYCMVLDQDDLKTMKKRQHIPLRFLNFGGPFQPVRVEFKKPEFPLHPFGGFVCNPDQTHFDEKEQRIECLVKVPINAEKKELLKKSGGEIWITVAAFNQSLQPISLII